MKRLVIFILVIILFSINGYSKGHPNKYALIIAIADYPEAGKWSDLSSDNDVDLIKYALEKQGFNKKNIEIVLNEKAIKQNIVSKLKNLAEKVSKGDIVVIHFSGHGQQIMDNINNDEIDGWDESWIPYDAQLYYSSTYKGENHLRDDEISVLLSNIRIKLGRNGNILVIIDSCHSGTSTRGFARSRGTGIKFAEPDYSLGRIKEQDSFIEFEKLADQNTMASMVVISGSSQEENNYEYFDQNSNISYGPLSYSLNKVLSKAKPETTYRALFDMIQLEMNIIAPNQSPQLEGDVDERIFGGEAIDQKPYFTVDKWENESTVTIKAGNLMGIYNGSIVGFYNINTSDPSGLKPKVTGTINNSSAIESEIILDTPLKIDEAKNSWIFVTKKNFGDMTVKVKIENLKNKQLENLIIKTCNELPTVEVVSENPELIIELKNNKNTDTLQIITTDELLVLCLDLNLNNFEGLADLVAEKLKGYAQASLLKAVQMQDPKMNVTFEIIPITIKWSGSRALVDKRLSLDNKRNNSNQLEFDDGDTFVIKVKNNGQLKAYFQIIDIQPDNSISILTTANNWTNAEYVIEPGEITELPNIFVFGEPFGTDIFKLIATRKPIDLSMIITSRGLGTKGFNSPFEQIFVESYKQTRVQTRSLPPGTANIFTVPFKVVEKHKK